MLHDFECRFNERSTRVIFVNCVGSPSIEINSVLDNTIIIFIWQFRVCWKRNRRFSIRYIDVINEFFSGRHWDRFVEVYEKLKLAFPAGMPVVIGAP